MGMIPKMIHDEIPRKDQVGSHCHDSVEEWRGKRLLGATVVPLVGNSQEENLWLVN